MIITVYFSEAGAAKTGLSPTIDIRDVSDGSLDIDDGAMTEVGSGWYKYDFAGATATKQYSYLCDGGTSLCDPERYIFGEWSLLEADWLNAGRLDVIIDAIKTKTDNQPAGVPKNVALSNFSFLMVLSSDHVTPATGKTLVEEISKDGGAFVACTNNFAEIGNGVYKIDLTQAEMNADIIVLKFTEASCDQRTITIKTSS